MRFLRETLFSSQDAAGNLASVVIDSSQLISASVQGLATGTIVGSLKLQSSNDAPSNISPPTDWSDIGTVAISAAGVVQINKLDLSYRWIRVTYTATSGAGNLSVSIHALGF